MESREKKNHKKFNNLGIIEFNQVRMERAEKCPCSLCTRRERASEREKNEKFALSDIIILFFFAVLAPAPAYLYTEACIS
jgi:hypothetical protein